MIETLPSYELHSNLYSEIPKTSNSKLLEDKIKIKLNLTNLGDTNTYAAGDIISGCVNINNDSGGPIDIDGILVSLTGLQSITNLYSPSTPTQIKKKLLDAQDISTLDKTLSVGDTVKQFAFKVPYYLLDNYCPNQITDHLEMPPTFGKKGDFATPGQSINYSITVKLLPLETIADSISITVDTKNTKFQKLQHLATFEQLKNVERYIDEEINILSERKNLASVGVNYVSCQDDIIFDSIGSKKNDNLYNCNKCKFIDVVKPLASITELQYIESSFDIKNSRFGTSCSQMFVKLDITTARLGTKIPFIISYYSKKAPPKEITFSPNLYAVNYQAKASIPIRFDDHFIRATGFSDLVFKKYRAEYEQKMKKLKKLYKSLGLKETESIYYIMAEAMATLNTQHLKTNVLKCEQFSDIDWIPSGENQWTFKGELTLQLCDSMFNQVPAFQSCFLGRFYLIALQISLKGQKLQMSNRFMFEL